MSKLKEGVRVVVIDRNTNEIKKGVIDKAYFEMEIAIVKFDDGNVEKVPYEHLHIEPENDVQETTEPVEKSEITITPDEFLNISSHVIGEITDKLEDNSGVIGLTMMVFAAELHNRLFRSEVDND